MHRIVVSLFVFVVSLLAVPAAQAAQGSWPDRPVRLITPYAPGGSSTIVLRIVAAYLTELWGQQVIVDNRPGGNTIIGTQLGARANPDGYTLLLENTTFALNHLLIRRLPYDSLKDFTPLANIYNNETTLAVNPSVPATTLKEFIAYLKAHPGEVNHGSGTEGGISELRTAMFRLYTGTDFKNIMYKGSGPVAIAVMGGEVQFGMVPPVTVATFVKNGKLRALAVTGKKRLAAMPDVPTFAEAGLPAYNVTSWNGLLVPAATPKALVNRISHDNEKVLQMPPVQERLASVGAEPAYADPKEFAAIIKADIERFKKVIKEANIPQVD
jgi:tripartite-type tricarboxylate transporter receptor subunit TctC